MKYVVLLLQIIVKQNFCSKQNEVFKISHFTRIFCIYLFWQDGSTALSIAMEAGHREIGIALYAKQHILSRENSPFNLSKSKRSRSANTVMPPSNNNMTYSHLSLKKSPSLQPKEYATLSSMLKTRIP